jgi:alpha-L-fucosidase 2
MFISSAKAVSNLQGIWADGPSSAWSGDYHTNINLQMNYWAAHSTGLASTNETLDPLIEFIERMASNAGSGVETASKMYGCKGWVMHGFTDQTLRAFPMAEPVWSLCVTCGAWLSMHLWDAITYESTKTAHLDQTIRSIQDKSLINVDEALIKRLSVVDNTILKRAIPIYRGIASFFLDYMWKDSDGHYHTGPTTSPENSYALIKDLYLNRSYVPQVSVEYFSASPAIDISVLREVYFADKQR